MVINFSGQYLYQNKREHFERIEQQDDWQNKHSWAKHVPAYPPLMFMLAGLVKIKKDSIGKLRDTV